MHASARAALAAAITALTGGAMAFAPPPPSMSAMSAAITAPVSFTASTGPTMPTTDGPAPAAWRQPQLLTIARQFDTPSDTFTRSGVTAPAATIERVIDERLADDAAADDPAVLNTASDIIDDVYAFTRYWANYVSLELGPWLINWIPFGYLISDQILIWYPNFVLPVVDSFVYDFLDPVVNDPLNLAVWAQGIGNIIDTAVTGIRNGVTAEIQYILDFGWFPIPLPPLPSFPVPGASLASGESAQEAVQRATVDDDASTVTTVERDADDVLSETGSDTSADELAQEQSEGSAEEAAEAAPEPVAEDSGDVVDETAETAVEESDAAAIDEADVEADVEAGAVEDTTGSEKAVEAPEDGDTAEPAGGDAPAGSDGGADTSGSKSE